MVLRLLGGWCFVFFYVGELSAVPLLASSGPFCDRLRQRAGTCVWTTETHHQKDTLGSMMT